MREVSRRPTKVLLVEKEPEDLEGFRATLEEAEQTSLDLEWVGRLSEALERLSLGGVDLVLLDLDLPDSRGSVTFERMHAFAPDVPVVILTDLDDETVALETVQAGAQDYLVRGQVTGPLVLRSVQYALERHRLLSALRSLSLMDDLTGLYNRRGFAELGEQHLKLSRRKGRSSTLVYVDVDDFKAINDARGHHVGDRLLVKVAEILRGAFRRSDLVGRLGGDEFAILALETSDEDAELLVDRLRAAIDTFNQNTRKAFELSVSVGVARSGEGSPDPLDELLARADAAMYDEKRAKRKALLP